MSKTNEGIIEGNKLIAEFMGGKKSKIDGAGNWIRFPEIIHGHYSFRYNNLCFHSSWDWLMPVVAKIYLLEEVELTMTPGSLEILYLSEKSYRKKVCIAEKSGLECWFLCVTDFLKWYYSEIKLQTK